jgi:hypothetical protein
MKVQDVLLTPSCPYVFPNFRGDHLTDLTAVVSTFGAKNSFSLPMCRAVRSAVEVQAMCRPPAEKQAIAHSTDTAEKHYREGLSIRVRLCWRTGV